MDWWNRIISKVTSGRLILTVIVGITFAVMAVTEKIGEDKVIEVTLLVMYGYFTKNREIVNDKE
jgi:hypothetical protein